MIRKFLERFNMVIPHTFRQHSSTYYSPNRIGASSFIDGIAVPMAMFYKDVMESHVWMNSGRALQLIRTVHTADHVPVALKIRKATYETNTDPNILIDRDLLMRCVTKGHLRKQYIEKVESNIFRATSTDEYKAAVNDNNPTKLYNLLIGSLRAALEETFAVKGKTDDEVKEK